MCCNMTHPYHHIDWDGIFDAPAVLRRYYRRRMPYPHVLLLLKNPRDMQLSIREYRNSHRQEVLSEATFPQLHRLRFSPLKWPD